MALLWIEGFEGIGTTEGVAPSPAGVMVRKYTAADETGMVVQAGRVGGHSVKLTVENTSYFSRGALTTDSTLVLGFGLKVSGLPIINLCFLQLCDDSTLNVNLWLCTDGELALLRGATVLQFTSGLGINPDEWYYVELKVVTSDTAGSYELRVNGNTEASASGIDTREGAHDYCNLVKFKGIQANKGPFIDDLYILDGTGTVNNDFLGNMKVTLLRPAAEGSASDFTPSSGTDNAAMVDDAECDDDATYVETDTVGHTDLYDYQAATGLSGIKGVQINADVRVTDVQTFDVKQVVKSGTTEDEGAATTVASTTYMPLKRIVEEDPDTSAAWTESGLSAAEFGVRTA